MICGRNFSWALAATCSLLVGWLSCTAVSTVQAASWYIDTPLQLRLRLKNDFRRAYKPNSSTNNDIYAWVQGLMLEFDSGWLNDAFGVEAGGFWVQRIDTDRDYYTRIYLNDRDSFGYATAAVKVKLGDYGLIKAGRFVTDYAYGTLPYQVPVLNNNSNRTLPAASQGVLLYLAPTDFIDVWAMWRNEVFLPPNALLGGFRYEGVFNPDTGDYNDHKANKILALSFYDDDWRWSTGVGYQEDVQTQVVSQLDNTFHLDGGKRVNTTLRYVHSQVQGLSKDVATELGWPDGKSTVITGSADYHTSWGSMGFLLGYLDHKSAGQIFDAEMGYTFALSSDRNKEEMKACQLNFIFKVTPDLSLMVIPIYTTGYENYTKQVEVDGYDLTLVAAYRPKSGPLEGLKGTLVFDRGIEDSPGSRYGDRLHYWDVKLTVQYDIDFLK